ncbi:MAG: terpene cyclase/mutase family protein [Phycisphaerae bacterium]|nr:terpene cyclase/mutase family protein [Phycisphaerae bacterium]
MRINGVMLRMGVSLVLATAAVVILAVGVSPRQTQAAPSKILPKMITKDTARRIERGLKFLERTQRHDGGWLNAGGYGTYPVVMTSLAGLALMAGGSTPESGPYAKTVSKALNFVLNSAESSRQKGKKEIMITGGGGEHRSMYGHGFGMLFLAQCYGVEGDKTSDRGKRMKAVLEGAVLLTAKSQSDLGAAKKHAGGWTYSPGSRSDEGSVTVTQLQALRACRNVGIKVPKTTIERTVLYLKYCQKSDGGICYSARSRGSSLPSISAAAVACFYSAGLYDRRTGGKGSEAEMVEKLVAYCKKHNMPNSRRSSHYFYTQFYMAQAMYQRGGKDWKEYFPQIRDKLAGMQMPDGNWNGDGIGPVYGTAIATMILQLPYGYLPIMQR